jgi:hypothetical protein
MTPKDKARQIFNSIRYMDNESGKDCATCDCVVLPIAKFMCDEIIKEVNQNFTSDRYAYWHEVKKEIELL